jgi:hypothetical protein
MIAPLHKPTGAGETTLSSPQFASARRAIAAAILPRFETRPSHASVRKPWLWAGWMLATVTSWILSLGL